MKKLRFLIYIWCLPWDILAWLVILLMWSIWGTKLRWEDGLWFEFKRDSWPSRTWYNPWAGTTFGHGGILGYGHSGKKGIDTKTEKHEHIHVEQFEVVMLSHLLMALLFIFFTEYNGYSLFIFFTIWLSGGFLNYLIGGIVSLMRGKSFYTGNIKEMAAYAITDKEEKQK